MKNFTLFLMLFILSLPAFAQHRRPRRNPHPNPHSRPCQVVAVNRLNRVVAHFYGRTEGRSGMCRDALRNCNFEVRRRGWWDVRCTQLRPRW